MQGVKYKNNHPVGQSTVSTGKYVALVAGVRCLNHAHQSTVLLSGHTGGLGVH